jgi:4-alpha-glucanotransferase
MMSVAERVMIPMQDVLGLGDRARMNRPSHRAGNWQWRLVRGQIGRDTARDLKTLVATFGRGG